MHDIGKLGILNALAETYELPTSVDFEVSEDLFDNIFPGIHENAGKYLAGHWKVNETIISAIEHHHDFEKYDFALEGDPARKLSAIVNISDAMARILGKGRRIDKTNIFELPAAKILGMEKDHSTVQFIDEIPEILFLKTEHPQAIP
jgi:HD-like signal output (HDOD) protein